MSGRFHWRQIGFLLLLAGTMQGWMVARNRVPAQDAAAFIQFARQFEHNSIADTLRRNPQHPLFPLAVWAEHWLFGGLVGDSSTSWLRSAQWMAALAAVLLVVPMYFAGVRLADRFLATGATALFSLLPVTARLGADALSDSTYLLFVLVGFWSGAEFLATRRAHWLAVAGVGIGLAYLARPEALLLPLAFGATCVVVQCRSAWRIAWRELALAAVGLAAGMLVVAAPYVVTTGKLTPKGSVILLPGGRAFAAGQDSNDARVPIAGLSDGHVVARLVAPLEAASGERLDFGVKHRTPAERFKGYGAAIKELTRELVEGLHYIFGLLVLVGISQARRQPANLFAALLAVVFALVLVPFASRAGYIASRHVLSIVCMGSFVAARGGWMLAGVLATTWGRATARLRGLACSAELSNDEIARRRLAGVLLAAAGVFCLPRNAVALHASREAHAEAGSWLAEHASAMAVVLDSRGWTALYSNLPSYNYHGARIAIEDPRLEFIVVERSEFDGDEPRAATLRYLLGAAGQKEAEFRTAAFPDETVQVFRWFPERLADAVRGTMRAPLAN